MEPAAVCIPLLSIAFPLWWLLTNHAALASVLYILRHGTTSRQFHKVRLTFLYNTQEKTQNQLGILKDKTIDDKFIHISHEDKLEYHVCNCILKLLMEKFGHY